MAYEKRWSAVAPRLLLADGTTEGLLQVADAIDLHVKQVIFLKGTALPNKKVQINAIPSQTEIIVGEIGSKINQTTDVSAFTTAAASTISAEVQNRPDIPDKEYERASFEEEPVVAKRVIQVDPYGNKYTPTNPFPVDATVSVTPSVIDTSAQITKVEIDDTGWTLLERSASTDPTGLGPLAGRLTMAIENLSGVDVYLQYFDAGGSTTVKMTLTNGFRKELDFGPNIQIYARASSGTVDITYEEAK